MAFHPNKTSSFHYISSTRRWGRVKKRHIPHTYFEPQYSKTLIGRHAKEKKTTRLLLPLNHICLPRPKNTGDVPRSAQRENGEEGGGVEGEGGGQQEHECGEESHFQSATETAWVRCLWSSSGLYHCWRERWRQSLQSLQRPLRVAPSSFHLQTRRREERDDHFKRQFDLRSTQEHKLKELVRRPFWRENIRQWTL